MSEGRTSLHKALLSLRPPKFLWRWSKPLPKKADCLTQGFLCCLLEYQSPVTACTSVWLHVPCTVTVGSEPKWVVLAPHSRQGSSEWPEPNSPLFLLVGIPAGDQLQSQHGLCQRETLLACSRQGTLGEWMLHALEFQAHLEEAAAGTAEEPWLPACSVPSLSLPASRILAQFLDLVHFPPRELPERWGEPSLVLQRK